MRYEALDLKEGQENTSLNSIQAYTDQVLRNLLDPHYTDHSIRHSYRILKILNRVLLQTNKQSLLTEVEKYIIQAAAFLHDIGMQEERWEPDNTERRDRHADLSVKRIQADFPRIGILDDLVEPICKVILAHRGDVHSERSCTIRTCEEVRLDLLEALLFIGDELDISQERVDIKDKKRLLFDLDNYIHFYKHYYTDGIDIKDNRAIQIEFRCPLGRIEQYKLILDKFVVRKLNNALTRVGHTLSDKYKIDIFLNESGIKYHEDRSLDIIDVSIYEQIIDKIFLPKGVSPLGHFKFDQMKGCHDPDIFYNGHTKWEDIVNGLDIRRFQYQDLRAKIKELFDYSCSNQCQTLLLVTGEACSGKSTVLMRLAYDMFREVDSKKTNLLWYDGAEEYDHLRVTNLYRANQKPIIILVDTPNIRSFVSNVSEAKAELLSSRVPALLIISARQSEWDNALGEKEVYAGKKLSVQLERLDDREIEDLLSVLDKHDKLGILKELTFDDRFAKFKLHCDRQLLVAMLEATRGKKFEEIVIDEYERLKSGHPEAARAYELVALFHMYFVSTPKSLLIRFLTCDDEHDFIERLLRHTRLIIVKDLSQQFGDYYKARHPEIARILISHLEDYSTEERKTKKIGTVINSIDVFQRHERYYIMNLLNNYIEHVVKFEPKKEYEDSLYALKEMLNKKKAKLTNMLEKATSDRHIPELVLLSRIFHKVGMFEQRIGALKGIISLNRTDKLANYYLANILARYGTESVNQIAEYYRNSYIGGNRNVKFLLDYVIFCITNGLYEHIDPLMGGIKDFAAYTEEEHEGKKKLEAILEGYRINKDRNRLAKDAGELIRHIEATKDLSPQDELFYIDTYEASNPKKAFELYERHLLTIDPSRPKKLLLRLAYLASKISDMTETARKYYEELFNEYIEPFRRPEDFPVVYDYFKFALRNNLYVKEKYYELFRIARIMNDREIALYSDFAGYLIQSKDINDLRKCAQIIDEGLRVAIEVDKIYISPAKRLRTLKEKVNERLTLA